MLYYENFRIRSLKLEDANFTATLRQDFSTNSMLGHFIFVNEDTQKDWISKLPLSRESLYFIFEKEESSNNWISIGLIRVNHIDTINRSASVGGDIAKQFRGNGYAKIMFKIIFNFTFNYLNLNRLWLHVLENNLNAINLYKKMGFIEEGTQRKAIFRDSKYLDYKMMSILKEEYQQLKSF